MKKLIAYVFLSLCILSGAGFWYWKTGQPKKLELNTLDKEWVGVLNRLHHHWENGVDTKDLHFGKNCPEFSKQFVPLEDELKGCRKKLFKCYYQSRSLKIKSGKIYKPYQVIFPKESDKGLWSFPVRIRLGQREHQIYLKNSCYKTPLPKLYYNHGRFVSQKNTWHPGDVDYWVDKYQVRAIDIMDWREQSEAKGLSVPKDKLFAPAVTLTKDQMESFCRYRGGIVMKSRVADAISYYSTESSKSAKLHKSLSSYPFTPRKTESAHYKAQKDSNYKVTRSDCEKVQYKECLDLGFPTLISETLGWSGAGELLGGALEYVTNDKFPRRNLILSSRYFSIQSPIHKAGERGHWDGEGLSSDHFKFLTNDSVQAKQYDVAFRCMGVQ